MSFAKYSGNLTDGAGSLVTALDTALVTGQGWAITFTATNKRVYTPVGARAGYRVDDTGAGTGGVREALIRGAEAWSDINTPSLNPFTTSAQSSLTANSLVLRKSATTTGNSRPYIVYADATTAILFIQSEATTYYLGPWYFGDTYSLVAGDAYRACLLARAAEQAGSVTYEPMSATGNGLGAYIGDATAGTQGSFIARCYLGTGLSFPIRHYSDQKFQVYAATTTYWTRGGLAVPNAPNGGIYLSRQHYIEYISSMYAYRCRLRGLWGWCHTTQPYADGDTLSGASGTELAGKTFQLVCPIQSAGAIDTVAVETSNTLETS